MAPHVIKRLRRHVRVAHDVVGGTQQFVLGKSADLQKRPIHIGEPAFKVGLGDDVFIFPKQTLGLGDGLVVAHDSSSRMLENFFCMTRGIFEYLDNGPQGSRLRRIAQ
jgi:hypothetical protein